MKKILQVLGAAVSSTIIGYLTWLLTWYITPFIMSIDHIFIYLVASGSVIFGVISFLSTILAAPIMYCTQTNKVALVVSIVISIFFAFSSIRQIWMLDMTYGYTEYVIGILHSIETAILFAPYVICPISLCITNK